MRLGQAVGRARHLGWNGRWEDIQVYSQLIKSQVLSNSAAR